MQASSSTSYGDGEPIHPAIRFSTADAIERTLESENAGYNSDDDVGFVGPSPSNAASLAIDASTATASTDAAEPRGKTQKDNARYRNKRKAAREAESTGPGHIKQVARKKRKLSAMDPIATGLDYAKDLKASTMGWMGMANKGSKKQRLGICELDKLVGEQGFRYIAWKGTTTHPLADSEGIAYGGIFAPPQTEEWAQVVARAAERIEKGRQELSNLPPKFLNHRRGKFPALPFGISHGGGQMHPGNLQHKQNDQVIYDVLHDPDVKRIAMLANHYFKAYAPRLYEDYDKTLTDLSNWSHNITRNYPDNAFAAASINFGPRTVSIPHYDHANLAWGLCAVFALGNYNPDTSGHLILWEPKLVIRFPPGCIIILPSALIKHANTPIAAEERRYSVAQYSASGLFRFVDNGFMTDSEWFELATDEQKAEREAKRHVRVKEGIARLSTVAELM